MVSYPFWRRWEGGGQSRKPWGKFSARGRLVGACIRRHPPCESPLSPAPDRSRDRRQFVPPYAGPRLSLRELYPAHRKEEANRCPSDRDAIPPMAVFPESPPE